MAESFDVESGDFTLVESSSSSLNGVIFHNVQAVYTADEAINCVYSIMDDIEPELGDVIGLFKVGWTSSSECFSSVPAKTPVNEDKQFLKSVFGAHLLPNDSSELYQFCYVSKMRVVGASTPFTFESSDIIAVEDPTDPGLLVFKSRVSQLKDELHKLSDEKTYYASKYKILYSNFLKLKSEFDNIEQELGLERENLKQLEEENSILKKQLKEKEENKEIVFKEFIQPEASGTKFLSKVVEVDRGIEATSREAADSDLLKSLHEIYVVATKINQSFEPQESGSRFQMPYQDFVSFVIEKSSDGYKKIENRSIMDEYCECYFQQKASCCPSLCSESVFKCLMTQPVYTCFSNMYPHSEGGRVFCDGSFDSIALTNYITAMVETRKTSFTNVADSKAALTDEKNNKCSSSITESGNEPQSIKMLEINKELIEPSSDILSQMNEEREKVNNELKLSRERIASLNSRVNVLELELVAQQSSHLMKSESLIQDTNQPLVPSSSSVDTHDLESILECVHNEYINLKDKYRDLSKNMAKMCSIEAKCSALEEENAKLIQYFTEVRVQNKNPTSAELETIIAEKQKVENKLISLQKESVGKISINLIQKHEG